MERAAPLTMEGPVAAQYAAVTYNKPRDTKWRKRVVLGVVGSVCVAAVALLAGGERGGAAPAQLGEVGRWEAVASPQRNGWFNSMRRHDTPATASGMATTDALSAARDALKVIANGGLAAPSATPSMIQPVDHQAAARMRVAARSQRLAAAPPQQQMAQQPAPVQKLLEAQHMWPWPAPPLQQVLALFSLIWLHLLGEPGLFPA